MDVPYGPISDLRDGVAAGIGLDRDTEHERRNHAHFGVVLTGLLDGSVSIQELTDKLGDVHGPDVRMADALVLENGAVHVFKEVVDREAPVIVSGAEQLHLVRNSA